MKYSILFATVLVLIGCQSLPNFSAQDSTLTGTPIGCAFIEPTENGADFDQSVMCESHYWLELWRSHVNIPWSERKILIAELGDTSTQRLQRFLLSQPLDTPYQARLRAQTDFQAVRPVLEPLFANLLEQLAYLPSQQLLEYESAITILSRVNTRQSLRIEEQAQKLLEQESKLIQLLRIEAEALEHTPER